MMSKRRKTIIFLVIAIVVLIIAIVVCVFVVKNRTSETIEETVDPASITKPEGFVFYDKNGNQVAISNYEGIPMCIVFFSSDSENARYVLNLIDTYYNEYKTSVIFLVIDTEEPDPDIIETMEGCGYSFSIYYDENNLVSEYYSYKKLPAILFLEEDGTKYNQFEGTITEDALIANLDLISGVEY